MKIRDLRDFLTFSDGGAVAAAEDPGAMVQEVDPDGQPAAQPPEAANYRPADVQGIACATCVKFSATGEVEDENGEPVPVGVCDQWEAEVRGDHVSDAYADDGPPLDEQGNEVWDFADGQKSLFEIHLAGSDTTEDQESGFVIKEVLRTGEWPAIPTKAGVIKKPLRIVRDGKSDRDEGVISLAELVENFKAGAIPNPQIPLSDDDDDHKNITRVNTGFIRDLWITDEGDTSKLVAKMEFTEPEVREKVLRGTYCDVSCGIPWQVRSRGREYGTALEHVAITNRPFIDGLGPFFAASDKNTEDIEVAHFGDGEGQPESEENQPPVLSFRQQIDKISRALIGDLGLSKDYEVIDIIGNTAKISNKIAATTWSAPFSVTDGENLSLARPEEWSVEEEGETEEPPARVGGSPNSSQDELAQARQRRELLFSAQPSTKREKEDNMPLTREELDRLELSDDTRAAILSVLDENASLRASTREQEADRRVAELEEMGLKERPGFLRLYRSVHLSDDGGPAIVLLSDNGQEKERLSAKDILDRAVEALKGSDGKVVLSDQHLASGNDDPPPATPEGENQSVEERTEAVKADLYGKRKK